MDEKPVKGRWGSPDDQAFGKEEKKPKATAKRTESRSKVSQEKPAGWAKVQRLSWETQGDPTSWFIRRSRRQLEKGMQISEFPL